MDKSALDIFTGIYLGNKRKGISLTLKDDLTLACKRMSEKIRNTHRNGQEFLYGVCN